MRRIKCMRVMTPNDSLEQVKLHDDLVGAMRDRRDAAEERS